MRYLFTAFLGLCLLTFFNSCQKEVSVEFGLPAKGSLQGDGGDCLPKTVAGTYMAGKALADSNFIEVTVNVLTAGPYTISSDTLNGYSFKATGTFAAAGASVVRLKGSGKPVSAGVNNFTVVFDSSDCKIAITVLPAGSNGGPATFTLVTAGTGCAAFDLQGNYVKDSTLTASNRVGVQVNVTATGTYSIATNTVNGYSFSTTGTFSTTGVQTVFLQGAGKPVAAQTDNFTVTAGTLTCSFPVTVSATAVSPCGIVPQGTYTAGTALNATNTITLTHNYTTAGSYTITTGTTNGYGFGPKTITATAGSNTIIVNGVGTPTSAGINTFTLNYGDGSSCILSVTVGASTPVTNTDHFPLTANSFWNYDGIDGLPPGDSVKTINSSTATFASNSYRLFQYNYTGVPFDSFYYRRSVNDYYEYNLVDYYSAFSFDVEQKGDILFLKENLATGDTWNSAEYTGTISGQAKKIRYVFNCVNANATVSVNGKSFSNVYSISFKGQTANVGSTSYQDDGLTWTAYYAKGIGLIYIKATDGTNTYEQKIRSWQVF